MIKKSLFISSILAFGISANAVAQPLICPFTDHFTIQGPTPTLIKNLSTDGNLNATIINDSYFTTSCKSNTSTSNGHVYLTVTHNTDSCNLTILDGPYESNPSITNVDCPGGFRYTGMEHVKGSYNYTLKFS